MGAVGNDAAINAFVAEVEKWKKLPQVETRRRRNRVAKAIIRGFVLGTPVLRGRARGGWGVGVGSAFAPVRKTGSRNNGKFDKSGLNTIRHAYSAIDSSKWDDNIVFENNVPYIHRLDSGYSREQAPAGIVAPVLIAVKIQFFG